MLEAGEKVNLKIMKIFRNASRKNPKFNNSNLFLPLGDFRIICWGCFFFKFIIYSVRPWVESRIEIESRNLVHMCFGFKVRSISKMGYIGQLIRVASLLGYPLYKHFYDILNIFQRICLGLGI